MTNSQKTTNLSLLRKQESIAFESPWIPAFAGMTIREFDFFEAINRG